MDKVKVVVGKIDEPQKLRRAQCLYLMSLCSEFAQNNGEAMESVTESVSLNNDNLFALYFEKFGFLR
ncbi:MAG: hypothetical protein IKV98_00925 [Clostridia bacterium]|nr:hypothetical protein [Clostridia bacterium]